MWKNTTIIKNRLLLSFDLKFDFDDVTTLPWRDICYIITITVLNFYLFTLWVWTFTEKWSQSKNVAFTIYQPFLGHFYYQVSPFLKNYCNFTKISKSYKGKSFFAIFTMLAIVSDIFEHVQYHLCMHVPLIP